MLRVLTATAIAAGMMAGSAAANTILDFTTSNTGLNSGIDVSTASGSVGFGGITYTISGSPRALVDSTRDIARGKIGCTGRGWNFACENITGTDRFDVGFGVINGINNNEIDGNITKDEYVAVSFSKDVILNGFAGMLTYNDSQPTGGFEQVKLEYFLNGNSVGSGLANAIFDDNDPILDLTPDNTFGTVGLAFLDGLRVRVNEVRFFATGTNPFDNGDANITAAGLKISAVPLPAGVLLLGLGLAGMAGVRRIQAGRKAA